MSAAADHLLFRAFPISGTVDTSAGPQPTPYHVYDGHALLIAGTADAETVARACVDQDVVPVLTGAGRASMGIFVCTFPDASHGPHQELQVSVLVRDSDGPPLPDTASAHLAALGGEQGIGSLCLHLWNDTVPVVAYNTEYLGLEAQLCHGHVTRAPTRLTFDFRSADDAPILSGDVRISRRPGLRIMYELLRRMGLRAFLKTATQPWTEADVINRKGPVITQNRRAPTRSKPDKMIVQDMHPQDRLQITSPAVMAYGFQPRCIQHLRPFRFVYLHPDEA